jgi:hypothetical protein
MVAGSSSTRRRPVAVLDRRTVRYWPSRWTSGHSSATNSPIRIPERRGELVQSRQAILSDTCEEGSELVGRPGRKDAPGGLGRVDALWSWARQCIALNDPATRLPVAALKKWEIPGGGLEARLFLPDRVVSYTAQAGSTIFGWRRTSTVENPLGMVPVVEFQNKPTLLGGGRSELANVIPVQDAVNKMITDLLVASEFNSFKMRYLLVDAKSEAFDRLIAELKTKAAALQRCLVVAGGQQVGAFPETILEGFVSAITLLCQHVATQTQTPPHYSFSCAASSPPGSRSSRPRPAWSPRSRTSRSCSARHGSG